MRNASMGICRDKSLTFLNDKGYNVIRLPRAGIEPLDLLGRDGGSMEWLGRLDTLWRSPRPVPQPRVPQPATDINDQKTSSLELSAGLTLLKGVLSAFSVGAGLDAAYHHAATLEFAFSDVQSIAVAPLEVGNFLAEGSADSGNPIIEHYFMDDHSDGFVITEVLKSNRLKVTARRADGGELKVDADQIKGVVGAKVDVSVGGSGDSTLTYAGDTPLTFGFKLFAIALVEGHWHMMGVKPGADTAFSLDGTHAGEESILLRRGMILLPEKQA
jgi:hypothetical protein